MSLKIDIPIGTRYGSLVVIDENGRSQKGDVLWKCKCDCGKEVLVRGFELRKGERTSCAKCPKTNNYTVIGDIAYGSIINAPDFIIDASDVELVKSYQWSIDNNGYVRTLIKGKTVKMHRLIVNASKGTDVDHINGIVFDNRKSNLRVCTHQQNMWNMKKPCTNKTGYKGVTKRKYQEKYMAGIRVNGKQTHLGCFDSKVEAAIAYDKAAIFYRGEYAKLNFPREIYEEVQNYGT